MNFYEVPAQADEAFLAAWREARATAILHRALRGDVDFRFAALGRAAALPFTTHAGRYAVVHEDGTPDREGGVLLINPFEVPEDGDEPFLGAWEAARAGLATQRGYLGTRLHRSVASTGLRFVDCARWSSPLMFARATGRPEFREAAAAMPFRSHPALYQPVRD